MMELDGIGTGTADMRGALLSFVAKLQRGMQVGCRYAGGKGVCLMIEHFPGTGMYDARVQMHLSNIAGLQQRTQSPAARQESACACQMAVL